MTGPPALSSLVSLFSTLVFFLAASPLLMLPFGAGSSVLSVLLVVVTLHVFRLLSGSEFPWIKVFRKQHCTANDGHASGRSRARLRMQPRKTHSTRKTRRFCMIPFATETVAGATLEGVECPYSPGAEHRCLLAPPMLPDVESTDQVSPVSNTVAKPIATWNPVKYQPHGPIKDKR